MNAAQQDEPALIENLPFSTDAGVGAKAKVGVVVLASDYTLDYEFRQVFNTPDVQFYSARIENSPRVTPQTLAAMEARIPDALRLILPGEPLDVVAYGCTSATTILGEETIVRKVQEVHPVARVTTPVTAAFAAFEAFKARRIAVLTPYRSDVNQAVQKYINAAGYQVPVFASFNEELDPVVAKIDFDSISAAIDRMVSTHQIDMVFVSCTSVRLMDSARLLEQRLGVPVTSSNHAMAWHCQRLAGVTESRPELGLLYEKLL
ncbi:Asp/Glu racemase [Chromatiales bacterium (ex Bugula neritina AB1)]|nr:Asp/Glu racemase [Chromatiales bacterium (ex Bugula neritina AB1)]